MLFDRVDGFKLFFNFLDDKSSGDDYLIHSAHILMDDSGAILVDSALTHDLIEFNLNGLYLFISFVLHLFG